MAPMRLTSRAQGIHRSRFGFHRVRVLTVTTSAARAENLRMAAANHPNGKGLFLFTDLDARRAAPDVLTLDWHNVSGHPETLLD